MKRLFSNFKTKKQKLSLSIGIIGLVLFITGISFAFFEANFLGLRDNELVVGQNLIFRYDETGTALNLSNEDALSDEDGISSTKYFDFEVSQQTSNETTTNYYIYLAKDASSTLKDSDIKVYLTDQSNNKLQDFSKISELTQHETFENSYYLYENSITSSEGTKVTDRYRLRVWIDETYNPVITEQDGVHSFEKKGSSYKFTVGVATGKMPEKPIQKDGSNANAPELASNMIPVIYDSGNNTWVKADKYNTDLTWFNYTDKKWANAVTVTEQNRETYLKASAGTPIPMSDINTMWVWIPRFSETMNGSYNGGTQASPGAFNITFVDKETSAHDAFDFGGAVSGFWMGKFENSSDITCSPASNSAVGEGCNLNTIRPKILPNATSWRGAMVSTFFYDILAMTESGNQYGFDKTIDATLDTHMLKNNEWGAVAYLTQSIYGRCTSSTSCTEVGINNNSSAVTGYGAPAGSSSSVTNGTYETSLGMDASTTGNIYGVYDMSGGASEYVMGAYWDGTKLWSGYSTSSNQYSGFEGCLGSGCTSTLKNGLAYPNDNKYYNLYTTESDYTSSGLQHGMIETSGWFSDSATFVNGNVPWLTRGGNYGSSSSAGVFYFYYIYGYSASKIGSRVSTIIN